MIRFGWCLAALVLVGLANSPGDSQEPAPSPVKAESPPKEPSSTDAPNAAKRAADEDDEETAVRRAGQDYLMAFNSHDATAVAEFWSPDAVYINRSTGEEVTGREAIAKQFAAVFADNGGLKLEVDVKSIQFVSPNVAVEHGVARLLMAEAEPEEVQYTAVYVRRDGKWLLDRVTDEAPEPSPPSNYEHLKEIEWMIGAWVDEDEAARVTTECAWTRNQNFITRSFTVSIDGAVNLAGMQIIGWDAAASRIRSWTFDSDGGFSEDNWSRKDNRWFVQKRGVLPDGRRAAATHIFKLVDDNSFTFQAIDRTVDGELLPNLDEVKIVRGE